MTFIPNPPEDMKAKWGALAYVDESERNKILYGAYGTFKPQVKALEKRINDMKKDEKRKESEFRQLHKFDAQKAGNQ